MKELSLGHSDPSAESGLESGLPFRLAVLDTVRRASPAPLNQEQLVLFPERNQKTAGVTVLGPCGLGKEYTPAPRTELISHSVSLGAAISARGREPARRPLTPPAHR